MNTDGAGVDIAAKVGPLGHEATATALRISELLQSLKVSSYGLLVLSVCVLVAMTEGYDIQAMALAAPLIKTAWALQSSQIGVLLAGSVIGMVGGSFVLAPLGDYIGRKPAITVGLVLAAAATAAGAYASDPATLLATRVAAGLGLGLALPVTVALAMEMMPPRLRTLVVVLVMSGYPLGAFAGGWVAGGLVDDYGYRAIFIVGGIGAAAAALLCVLVLPESAYFLARAPKTWPKLVRLLRRLRIQVPPGQRAFVSGEPARDRSAVAALFTRDRRFGTLMLWLICFANMGMVYFFVNWLPTLFQDRGLTADMAIKSAAVFNGGGVVGGISLALLMRRLGPPMTLSAAYVVATAAILALAFVQGSGAAFLVTIFLCGAVIGGSQMALTAVVNQFYPSSIRVTGGGYATGVGRLGAVAAPLTGGVILGVVHSPQQIFLLTTVPALVALAAMAVLWRKGSLAAPQGG